jgi:hypothetical protein
MSRKMTRLLLLSLLLLSAANWFYARKAKAAPQLILWPARLQVLRPPGMG